MSLEVNCWTSDKRIKQKTKQHTSQDNDEGNHSTFEFLLLWKAMVRHGNTPGFSLSPRSSCWNPGSCPLLPCFPLTLLCVILATIVSASSMDVKSTRLSFTRSCQPLWMCPSDLGGLQPQTVCIYKPNSCVTCCLQLFTYFSEGVWGDNQGIPW